MPSGARLGPLGAAPARLVARASTARREPTTFAVMPSAPFASAPRIDPMNSAARPLHRPGHWRRFAMRGAKSAAAGGLVALCLWVVSGHDFGQVLVYSLCISLMCWFFIDVGRDLVALRLARRAADGPDAPRAWPGWIWMLGIVAVGGVLGYAAGNEIANWLTGLNSPGPFNAGPRGTLPILMLALVPAIVITYFFYSREIIAMQKTEVATAQRQAAEQQLKLLESQLEPHMLFNTLANLRALIGVDPARAQLMLDQLIAFLRASLAGSRTGMHSLEAEFQRLRDYLALMQIRMGQRLATQFELPAELAGAQVPPLLLQPLVENSIKHGLEPHLAGGRIDVSASRDGGMLVLRVRDSGAGLATMPASDKRYGLAHVRERLATLYGSRASFSLASAADAEGGTLATIRMPLETASPLAEGARP
jgi:Histidine kinase